MCVRTAVHNEFFFLLFYLVEPIARARQIRENPNPEKKEDKTKANTNRIDTQIQKKKRFEREKMVMDGEVLMVAVSRITYSVYVVDKEITRWSDLLVRNWIFVTRNVFVSPVFWLIAAYIWTDLFLQTSSRRRMNNNCDICFRLMQIRH